MTETPGFYGGELIPQPAQRFTRPEQIELLLWHPLFTGRCPQCGQDFGVPQETVLLTPWECHTCGWQEHQVNSRTPDRA